MRTLVLGCAALLAAAGLATAQETPRPPDQAIDAFFQDGLQLKSRDGNFDAHIGGRFLEHYRSVFDRPDDDRTSPDSFFVRSARIEMSATFYRDFEFRVQPDFSTGSSSATTGTLQDGYVGWKRFPEFSIRLGQFKEPFSQEETTSNRFIDFAERSALSRLAPGRDIGIGFNGKVSSGLFEYEASVFNGQGRGVVDGSDEKDVAIRLRTTPTEGLRLGVAAAAGDVDDGDIDGLDFTTTELAVVFLDATTGSIDGLRTRLGAELSWLYGPFGIRAEVVRRTDRVDIGALDGEKIDIDAWYVAATWLVTGEKKPLEGRVVPDRPFDLSAGGWGAFELAVRAASLQVDRRIFDLGIASPATDSRGVTTFTFGVNWFPTRNFRVTADFILERYRDEVAFASGPDDSLIGVLTRFQIDF